MHLLSVCVKYCQIFFENNIHIFPNGMGDSLIETSAIKNFSKSSSFKRSSGNFGTSSSSPFPKAKGLEPKEPQSVCLAVIRQVDAILPNAHGMPPILFYSQSGSLDPADIKSIQCVIGRVEDREKWGLVDSMARWHMQYLLSERRHDRATELRATPFSLRAARCLAAVRGVWSIDTTITVRRRHAHRALARLQFEQTSLPTFAPSSCQLFSFHKAPGSLASLPCACTPGCAPSSLRLGQSYFPRSVFLHLICKEGTSHFF
jgi:hypothetical protein